MMLKHLILWSLAAIALLAVPLEISARNPGFGPAPAVKCANCGKEKPSAGKAETGAGKTVDLCFDCWQLPRCAYCQMPSSVETEGGDKLCRDCAKDTIRTKAEAEKVMKDVRQVLSTKFKMTSKHKIDYELGTRKDLNLEADGNHLELGWFDPKTVKGKQHYTIRILTGLPRGVFRPVVAHELAHDWMDENLPHLSDKDEIREGFAEFVAWSFSREEGNKRMMKYTENRTDDVYGGGFRKVREMMGSAKTASEWKTVLLKEFPLKQTKKNGK